MFNRMVWKTIYKAKAYSAHTKFFRAVKRQPDFSKRKQTNTRNPVKLQRLPASLPALQRRDKDPICSSNTSGLGHLIGTNWQWLPKQVTQAHWFVDWYWCLMIPLGRSIATILIPAFLLYWHRGARRGAAVHARALCFRCTGSTRRRCRWATAGARHTRTASETVAETTPSRRFCPKRYNAARAFPSRGY